MTVNCYPNLRSSAVNVSDLKNAKEYGNMDCHTFYKESTTNSSPEWMKKRFGTWRKEELRNLTYGPSVRVEKFTDFLVGVYLIENAPCDHQRKLSIFFNELRIDLLTPVNPIPIEEYTEEITEDYLSAKNCLPEPLPVAEMMYNEINIGLTYTKFDERLHSEIGDCSLLLIYDHADKGVYPSGKCLIWQNKIRIQDGYADIFKFPN